MPNPQEVCVIILTFNSEKSLGIVVQSCKRLNARIVVVDSYSVDGTVELAKSLGCEVHQHPFENYSRQRNWAQETVAAKTGWYLHLDSDEVLSPKLCDSILKVLATESPSNDGYIMRRSPYFLGKRIRFGAINPTWHLRLYRVGKGKCEDRSYDQHYVMDGPAAKLEGDLLDLQLVTVEQWTASHNRWSTAESHEVLTAIKDSAESDTGKLKASLMGDSRMKKRWIKNKVWYNLPPLVRPYLFFFYSYFLKLGILDGKVGLIYHVLQAFWFRFLVDAKIYEQLHAEKTTNELMASLGRDLG